MAIQLSREDFHHLSTVLGRHGEWRTVRSRIDFMTEVLAASPGRDDILGQLDLDGTPRGTAVRTVERMASFGQDQRGREALGVLINKLIASLGGGDDASFLHELLGRYEFTARPVCVRAERESTPSLPPHEPKPQPLVPSLAPQRLWLYASACALGSALIAAMPMVLFRDDFRNPVITGLVYFAVSLLILLSHPGFRHVVSVAVIGAGLFYFPLAVLNNQAMPPEAALWFTGLRVLSFPILGTVLGMALSCFVGALPWMRRPGRELWSLLAVGVVAQSVAIFFVLPPGVFAPREPPVLPGTPPEEPRSKISFVPRTVSGPDWLSRFADHKSIDDLDPAFRANVEPFLNALKSAGANVYIGAARRPPERAYLMCYAWRIARAALDPREVPPMLGVNIAWTHQDNAGNVDLAASKSAAEAMVVGFGLFFPQSLTNRHTQGRAIDLAISWNGSLQVKQADGTSRTIPNPPRSGLNPELVQVGKTYGVIKSSMDPPHWSDDGR
jgi:hypothetical protein